MTSPDGPSESIEDSIKLSTPSETVANRPSSLTSEASDVCETKSLILNHYNCNCRFQQLKFFYHL